MLFIVYNPQSELLILIHMPYNERIHEKQVNLTEGWVWIPARINLSGVLDLKKKKKKKKIGLCMIHSEKQGPKCDIPGVIWHENYLKKNPFIFHNEHLCCLWQMLLLTV